LRSGNEILQSKIIHNNNPFLSTKGTKRDETGTCLFRFAIIKQRQGYTTKRGEVSGIGTATDRITICADCSFKHK